jgi:hypothetical protein
VSSAAIPTSDRRPPPRPGQLPTSAWHRTHYIKAMEIAASACFPGVSVLVWLERGDGAYSSPGQDGAWANCRRTVLSGSGVMQTNEGRITNAGRRSAGPTQPRCITESWVKKPCLGLQVISGWLSMSCRHRSSHSSSQLDRLAYVLFVGKDSVDRGNRPTLFVRSLLGHPACCGRYI